VIQEDIDMTTHVTRRRFNLAIAAALATPAAFAQVWPAKPIRIIVPYPPGGSSDIIARSISQPLSEALGQSVIIDNKAGANGNLGADLLAKAPADGYTLMLCDLGALAISPSLYPKLPFDPSKDLRSVSMLAYSPHLLVVHPSVQANTLKELVELSKKSDLNFAVTASGSTAHLAGIELQRKVGAKWEYVPYKGGVQAVLDTVSGQTQVLMNGMLATYPQVQSGKLKLIAVSKATRMPLIGSVPTIAEQGVPGYESGTWQGVVAARGVPDAVIARLNKELVRIIRTPDIRARLAGQGAEVVTMTAPEQDQFFAKERARWAQVIKEANVRLD